VAVVGLRAHHLRPDSPFIDHASAGLDTQYWVFAVIRPAPCAVTL
jgi:hypothetical protein